MRKLILFVVSGLLALGMSGLALAKHQKLRVAAVLVGPANDASWNAAACVPWSPSPIAASIPW